MPEGGEDGSVVLDRDTAGPDASGGLPAGMRAADPYRVVRARTVTELDAATRIRFEVYSRTMRFEGGFLPSLREVNGFDLLDTTDLFVAYRHGQPIATLRLLRPNGALARHHDTPLGLPLTLKGQLTGLPPGAVVAELGRAAVLPAYRGSPAIGRLYQAAYESSLRAGVSHWIGLALTGTDSAADAGIMMALLKRRGRLAAAPTLSLPKEDEGEGLKPAYGTAERLAAQADDLDGLVLPRAVEFHLGTGGAVIGAPLYDPVFREYMIPLFMALEDFPHSPLGRRYCGVYG
ncbi:GNAT family N-acetyltransferase [Methylobacterium organophilum]|uniref:GNAT family N-acyltransferase n=1 Tax=Methylobacterium organophilum TaxID=410 RepID=UPI001F1434DC|nr:GNAT family N-acyltransferase [Methylobacterium organophilum]UMY15542.1 GNAT family N-acetyltransferase [Methylobacterium organophilum]